MYICKHFNNIMDLINPKDYNKLWYFNFYVSYGHLCEFNITGRPSLVENILPE